MNAPAIFFAYIASIAGAGACLADATGFGSLGWFVVFTGVGLYLLMLATV